ncbi:MAG: hypothetical protein Q7T03_10470 [Deltaproteobacteria bacterium]|nr:hypothetical protein [Deltaproteobacteria bacterium]
MLPTQTVGIPFLSTLATTNLQAHQALFETHTVGEFAAAQDEVGALFSNLNQNTGIAAEPGLRNFFLELGVLNGHLKGDLSRTAGPARVSLLRMEEWSAQLDRSEREHLADHASASRKSMKYVAADSVRVVNRMMTGAVATFDFEKGFLTMPAKFRAIRGDSSMDVIAKKMDVVLDEAFGKVTTPLMVMNDFKEGLSRIHNFSDFFSFLNHGFFLSPMPWYHLNRARSISYQNPYDINSDTEIDRHRQELEEYKKGFFFFFEASRSYRLAETLLGMKKNRESLETFLHSAKLLEKYYPVHAALAYFQMARLMVDPATSAKRKKYYYQAANLLEQSGYRGELLRALRWQGLMAEPQTQTEALRVASQNEKNLAEELMRTGGGWETYEKAAILYLSAAEHVLQSDDPDRQTRHAFLRAKAKYAARRATEGTKYLGNANLRTKAV